MSKENYKFLTDARMLESSGIGRYLRENLIKSTDLLLAESNKQNKEAHNRKVYLLNSGIYNPLQNFEIPFRIRNSHYDIYWSPHFNIPWRLPGCRYSVATIHDLFHISHVSNLPFIQKKYADLMIRQSLKSDKIITVSNFTKNEILRNYRVDEEKIVVIHNGIDVSIFNAELDLTSTETLDQFGITKKYLLAVGNVKPHKNLTTLLKAFEALIESGADLQLLLVGKQHGFLNSEDLSVVLKTLKHADRIIFTGFVSDYCLSVLYKNASVFVFPSLYEGFGLPPLEAQACGVPVVVSDIEPLREVCVDSAIYFQPLDWVELNDKLTWILQVDSNKKEEIVKVGLENVQKYSWSRSRKQHLEVFNSLIK